MLCTQLYFLQYEKYALGVMGVQRKWTKPGLRERVWESSPELLILPKPSLKRYRRISSADVKQSSIPGRDCYGQRNGGEPGNII